MSTQDGADEKPATTGLYLKEVRVHIDEDRLEVRFHALNQGETSLYVQCGVRQVLWDNEHGELTLCFSDRRRHEDARHQTVPRCEILEPGEQKAIQASVPLRLNRLLPLEEGRVEFEVWDLSSANTVKLVVGVASTPFYPNPKRGETLAQLKAWGSDVERLVEVGERP